MSFASRTTILMDLGVTETALVPLQTYIELLWKSNENLNLFSRKMSFEELIDNHLIDGLLALKHFPQDVARVADFGSGGGIPGVLYAICFPQIKFQLFEKSPLKQDFLNQCRKIAPNIEVTGDIPIELRNIDLVISRAFKPLDVMLDMSRYYFQNGGRYFLFKGRREKIEEEVLLAKKKFKELKIDIVPLKSPVLEVERHLVRI